MDATERIVGYCTNVHAGANWAQTAANLREHAAAVKRIVSPDQPLPVGLWLSNESLTEMLKDSGAENLAVLCSEFGLEPFTFNGFPFGNFHDTRVKHAVYHPAWDQPERAAYTIALAKLHAALADGECERSISTLPIGWSDPSHNVADLDAAMFNLRSVAETLAELHRETGVLVHVDIEPEPGCIVETSHDILHMFERLMHGATNERVIRRHVRVCHDICHAAVMYEDQAAVMARYREAGIRVGKVQISSALKLNLHNLETSKATAAVQELRPFAEDRYLHQTTIDEGSARVFYEDLPVALDHYSKSERVGDEWRVHFHVPIFLDRVGKIGTTQDEILACFNAIRPEDRIHHFEVETYTWNVLPEAMQSMNLADGIARELQWVETTMDGVSW